MLRRKTTPILVAMLLAAPAGSIAQPNDFPMSAIGDSSLKVGDQFPDVPFSEVIGTVGNTYNKPIIFDFWATWCGSCIAGWEKIDSLQRKYKDRVQFILVNSKNTGDTKNKILKTFDNWRNNKGEKISVPTLIGDTILSKLFVHTMLPHYVWISPSGKVVGFTSADEINSVNIDRLLLKGEVALDQKEDLVDYDYKAPLSFSDQRNDATGKIKYRSTIGGYQPGLPNSVGIVNIENNTLTKAYCTNSNLLQLYRLAYPALQHLNKNQIRFNIRDKQLYEVDDQEKSWQKKNSFTYELIIPYTDSSRIQSFIQQDVDRYFGYGVSIDSVNTDVYSLQVMDITKADALNKENKLATTANLHVTSSESKYIINGDLNFLVFYIDRHSMVPVINNTGIKEKVTVKNLPANLGDIPGLNKTLKNYGLELIKTKKKLPVATIYDLSR